MSASHPASHLGYEFSDKLHPGSPGCLKLDVHLTSTPSQAHYDPVSVALPVVAHTGENQVLAIHHPWHPSGDRYLVCAGRIVLRDRRDKEMVAFGFGGDLKITSNERWTWCVIHSPAPILKLCSRGTFPMLLATEVEILLAKRAALWVAEPKEYEQRLADLEPFEFYAACLNELYDHYHQSALELRDEAIHHLMHCIHDERAKLEGMGLWPADVPALDDLL